MRKIWPTILISLLINLVLLGGACEAKKKGSISEKIEGTITGHAMVRDIPLEGPIKYIEINFVEHPNKNFTIPRELAMANKLISILPGVTMYSPGASGRFDQSTTQPPMEIPREIKGWKVIITYENRGSVDKPDYIVTSFKKIN